MSETLNLEQRKWLDNAFWETPQKEILNAICEYKDEQGRDVRKVMKMNKHLDSGVINPEFQQCIDYLTEDKIDASTAERKRRKLEEAEIQKQKELEKQRAKKLEQLFEYKLETFEIEEIKNSKNRQMKSKLRRAKSIPEVNLYAMMIVKDALEDDIS